MPFRLFGVDAIPLEYLKFLVEFLKASFNKLVKKAGFNEMGGGCFVWNILDFSRNS